jgi:NAD(P)-dependent dehydrogenase (short-subunit alcohol dehydrogenase family)
MEISFAGKVVIITGGALGMGRAAAVEFCRAGASVAIADVDAEAGHAAVAECERAAAESGSPRSAGGSGGGGSPSASTSSARSGSPEGAEGARRALFVEGDVAQAATCREVVRRTVDGFGGVDILFNNVGIQPAESYLNVEQTPEETWDRILGVNLKSYFLMAKYAIPEMRQRGGGVIVNNASVQGLQSAPGVPAYAASKGGVLSLTRQLAVDYAPEGIRVLAVCPGTVETEMVREAARHEGGSLDDALRRYGRSHPIGRIAQPREIANAVLFLASDNASFMTGEYVCVDGGLMALGAWASGPAPGNA